MSNKRIKHWNIIALLLVVYDLIAVNMAYFGALLLRFDFRFSMIPNQYLNVWKSMIPIYSVFCLLVIWGLKLYNSLWRFASYNELVRVTVSSIITTVFHVLVTLVFFHRMPISYYVLGAMLQFMAIIAIRFSYRFVLLVRSKTYGAGTGNVKRIMLIGAGNAGQIILRDIQQAQKVHEKVVCIIDDNPNKWGRIIDGIKIVGGRDDILENARKYNVDKIYIAIPSATAHDKKEIVDICKETGCEIKTLPGIYQLAIGDVTVSSLKEVSVEDLLGREPVSVNLAEVFSLINGKRVLVTGGGGSIGSELCRQIAAHNPSQLIIVDVYENNAYDIQLELKEKYPDLDLVVRICSVRDSRKMFQVFEKYQPQIVYHAAAHKHVPLMEDAPCEAIKNNSLGTYKTAYAAMVNGCERFVLISTDKAVNPTNIMGASKRLCEMIIQSFDKKIKEGKAYEIPELFTHEGEEKVEREKLLNTKTEFVAVRFGNVLGSNGSVIPIFKKQIEKGGPVTVTHPDIIRYFMTIPEAVSLVLLAGTYAKGGEIFVLDMGSPVKIDTLARNLIKLSGLKPDVDIKIEYTGLRPGEKLYEEKLMSEEGLTKTDNKMIYIGKPIAFDTDEFLRELPELMTIASLNKSKEVKKMVSKIVPTYHPVSRSNLGNVKIDEGYTREVNISGLKNESVYDDQ
ncbi:MAG: polysaccharide biosynthesis protein [Erysipelotrichaceae bacterium]|nr:polysaccharide biosynthesis protein [Erysipelotrichaceae bacterium]